MRNMDEVPVSFNIPWKHTVDEKGIQVVRVITTDHEKTNFTFFLCVTAEGSKHPRKVIFKRKSFLQEEPFPNGIVVKVKSKGRANSKIMMWWIEQVWIIREGSFTNRSFLVVWDSAPAHLTDELKNKVRYHTSLAVIPGGFTKSLQQSDLTVKWSFKCKLRAKWNVFIAVGPWTPER